MKRSLTILLVLVAVAVSLGNEGCPTPTKSTYTEQRKVPFFKVLTYERAETQGSAVEIILFEDMVGNCYITSGMDGGIAMAPKTACAGARTPALEGPASEREVK